MLLSRIHNIVAPVRYSTAAKRLLQQIYNQSVVSWSQFQGDCKCFSRYENLKIRVDETSDSIPVDIVLSIEAFFVSWGANRSLLQLQAVDRIANLCSHCTGTNHGGKIIPDLHFLCVHRATFSCIWQHRCSWCTVGARRLGDSQKQ